MRIITRKRITEYSSLHADAEIALVEWYEKTTNSIWNCFTDVKLTFNSADSVGYWFTDKNRLYSAISGFFYHISLIINFNNQRNLIKNITFS
jgi:mRNA interferase HigB